MTNAVVGCSDCQSIWIPDDRAAEPVTCPTCGTQHARDSLRTLAQADDLDGVDLDSGVGGDLVADSDNTDSSDRTVRTQSPGTGPDVDVPVADCPQLRTVTDTEARDPGVSLVEPGGQLGLTGKTYREVGPRTSDWLADVVADLVPSTARLVQDIARERYDFDYRDPNAGSGAVATFIHEELVDSVAQLSTVDAETATIEEARSYLDAIGRYALLWADDVYRVRRGFNGSQQFERIQRTLETTGTSHGTFNAGVDALRHSLATLHAERAVPLPLTFVLDGEQWTAADRETIKRALAAFDSLATGFDVRLWMSPGVRQRVRRLTRNALDRETTPAWAESFAFLTDTGQTSRQPSEAIASSPDPNVAADAWEFVDENRSQTGLLTVLAHLGADETRSVQALKRDAAIDYADPSIDRYVSDLEAAGFVDIDRTHASNRVSLTPLGAAAQSYVDPTGTVVHPDQSSLLGASYRHPPASHKYSVAPQTTGGGHHPPAEQWLADTGKPTDEGYIQFLGDPAGPREVEPPVLHRRILTAERVSGVNFVDSDIIDWTNDHQAPTGDGRVTYVSVFDDHALAVAQWGGPAQTLARLCAGLLGNRMLSKALSIDAVGPQFDKVHCGVESFENDLHQVLTRAQQIGWLSEDELDHYDNWRERIGGVRSNVLSKVGELDELDSGLRRELFNDLQGLLCSATHLYHAAGIDVSFNIRLPRTAELQANPDALQDFLDFMRFTVTKQAGYEDQHGFHSIYRMLIEDRPQKLKSRAAYEIGDDPTADLTASWIITGPDASDLRDPVQEAIAEESSRLRERVAEGVEDAALLEVPTAEANSYGHIRQLVREIADSKGFTEHNRQDIDRLTRCLEAALATADRGPDPSLVADALLALEARDTPHDRLDTWSVKNALATLPAEALFPTLPPSVRRMLSALFASDEPLTRQDLIEVTSESSYDRHWRELRAFYLVERTDDGFVAHLEPWWAPTSGRSDPFHEANPCPAGTSPPADPRHILLSVVCDSIQFDLDPVRYYELGKPDHDWLWILEELGLSRWQPILAAHCSCLEADTQSYAAPSGVRVGPPTPGEDSVQTTLQYINPTGN